MNPQTLHLVNLSLPDSLKEKLGSVRDGYAISLIRSPNYFFHSCSSGVSLSYYNTSVLATGSLQYRGSKVTG